MGARLARERSRLTRLRASEVLGPLPTGRKSPAGNVTWGSAYPPPARRRVAPFAFAISPSATSGVAPDSGWTERAGNYVTDAFSKYGADCVSGGVPHQTAATSHDKLPSNRAGTALTNEKEDQEHNASANLNGRADRSSWCQAATNHLLCDQ